jgi:hypothetical protein
MLTLIEDINRSLSNTAISTDCIFHVNDIKTAVSRLKSGKREGNNNFSSDHIINAGDDCLTHIAFLFSAITIHGTVADNLLISTIVPIPKGHNANSSDSANFRGIALSSVYGKIFDHIIMERYQEKLMSCELQFGFKAKSSTNLCSMVLKETIAYYTHNDSAVFCTFLDATKAFDRLHYCKLFKLLIKRQLPAHIIRVLINLYTHNLVCVSWCGVSSNFFTAVNGVKQGAVLSPVLFCIYIDELLTLLSQAGVGCYIGSQFVGVLAYADDVVIIAPTATAMRKLLDICDDYARQYNMSFNANKSKWLAVVPRRRRTLYDQVDQCLFFVGGKRIDFVNSFVHLGHIISAMQNDDDDVRSGVRTSSVVNNMTCTFNKLDSFTRYRLFRSYCSSFYGCELWLLSNIHLEDLCASWRKSLRTVWRLPSRTHSFLLPLISSCLPLFDELCKRTINFAQSCIRHESNLVRFVSSHGILNFRGPSILGQNVWFCTHRFKCRLSDAINCSINALIYKFVEKSFDDSMRSSASFLVELLLIRDNTLSLYPAQFSATQLSQIIEYVCVS